MLEPWKLVLVVVGVVALLAYWAARPTPLRRILLLCVLAEVAYGVVQAQVSARLCLEYYTAFHPLTPGVRDPTLLGLLWGFLGSWWVGIVLGVAAGLTARVGSAPPLSARDLLVPVLVLLAFQAGVSLGR